MDKWDVNRVLIDSGSQAEILFLSAFDQMRCDRKQLKEATKPFYGLGGRGWIELVGSFPVSFWRFRNARTKFVTIDVVNMHYLYDAIFSRGLLNTFEAALH
jgi:hypothetical protein